MRLRALAVAASLGCPLLAHADVRYTVTELQLLPGSSETDAVASHTNGLTVGEQIDTSQLPNAITCYPVLWQNATPTQLPLPAPSGWQGFATAVNAHGDVAGQISQDPYGSYLLPVLWTGNQIQMLDLMGMPWGGVSGISNQGTVVGTIGNSRSFPSSWAVAWSGGQATILGNFPSDAQAEASAINNAGQIVVDVGYAFGDSSQAFVWSKGSLTPMATLGGSFISANAINDAGEVVGTSTTPGDSTSYAFAWANGTTTALPSLPTDTYADATAINSAGAIVGFAFDAQGDWHAVIWTDGQYSNLNDLIPPDSGWLLQSAYGIADDGSIVGLGVLNGQTEGFLLTPVGDASVPEPASLALLGLGTFLMLRRRR